jgi:hypothetical protein
MCKRMRLTGRGRVERQEDDWMRYIFGKANSRVARNGKAKVEWLKDEMNGRLRVELRGGEVRQIGRARRE